MLAADFGLGHFEFSFVVVLGPVVGGALEVPDFDLEAGLRRKRVAEGDGVFAFRCFCFSQNLMFVLLLFLCLPAAPIQELRT